MKVRELLDEAHKALKRNKEFLVVEDTEIEDLLDKPPPLPIHFYRVKFLAPLYLDEAKFRAGAIFVDVQFMEEVHFAYCHFNGPAYFWKCCFDKDADFSHIVVLKGNPEGGRLEVGEANFAYTEFKGKADFRHAVFKGPTYFWRTIFNREVDFEVARFAEAAVFMGKNHDICVHKRDFYLEKSTHDKTTIPNDIAEKLAAFKILRNCEDRKKGDGYDGYYNFDSTIASSDYLKTRLKPEPSNPESSNSSASEIKQPVFSEIETNKIVVVWENYEKSYMFNGDKDPNFMEATFGLGSWFRHVSLRRCKLLRTDLSKTQFDGVEWEEHTAFFGFQRLLEHKFGALGKWLEKWLKNNVEVSNPPTETQPASFFGWLKAGVPSLYNRLSHNAPALQELMKDKAPIALHRLKRKAFFLHRRSCIYDELRLAEEISAASSKLRPTRKDCDWIHTESMEVSHIYHQLRSAADSVGDRDLARSFYYGEMEMARKAPPRRSRSALAFWYMFLSGYGTRENLAGGILLVLMLIVFPSIYRGLDTHTSNAGVPQVPARSSRPSLLPWRLIKANAPTLAIPQKPDCATSMGSACPQPAAKIPSHVSRLVTYFQSKHWKEIWNSTLEYETRSLEASTFFVRAAGPPKNDQTIVPRFVESVERIIVSVQAGLFVLSLRSRFQRGPD